MNKAAKRYAKALFELAEDQQKIDEVHADLQAVYSAIQNNEELKNLLTNPTLTNQNKAKIVNKIFSGKVSGLTGKLIHLLGEKGRLNLLPDIYKSFDALYKKKKGIVNASVITPVPLTGKLEKEIYDKVRELTGGKEIYLDKKVDPSLLGGFILQIDDLKYDASIKGKLARIKSKLVEN